MTTETNALNANDLAARYVRLWNEADPARRKALMEGLFDPAIAYVDPIAKAVGYDEFNQLIGSVRSQFTGLHFGVAGRADAHHDVARFSWSLGAAGADSLVVGTDIAVVGPAGKVTQITGFLDKVPG